MMLKKALFSLVTCMAILAPVAAHASTDPTDPLTVTQSTVAPADWTAPSPFVTDPTDPLAVSPDTVIIR